MNFISRKYKKEENSDNLLTILCMANLHLRMHLIFRHRITGLLDASGSFHIIDFTPKKNFRHRIIGLLASSGSFDVIDFTPKNIVCFIFFHSPIPKLIISSRGVTI